jgi:hypothetical protein
MQQGTSDAPPTVTTLGHTDEPPRWPSVVGGISIGWAALGLLCGGCGVLSPILMWTFLKSAEAQFGPMPEVLRPDALQIALAGAGMLWAAVLLVAGIMLTLRKPASRPLHLVYAAGGVVLTAVASGAAVMHQLRIAEWVAQNPDNKWAQQQNPTMSFVMLGVYVLLGLAWPLFCLVWFGLVKRTAADIAGGGASAG